MERMEDVVLISVLVVDDVVAGVSPVVEGEVVGDVVIRDVVPNIPVVVWALLVVPTSPVVRGDNVVDNVSVVVEEENEPVVN